jgi:hypothetical protein
MDAAMTTFAKLILAAGVAAALDRQSAETSTARPIAQIAEAA